MNRWMGVVVVGWMAAWLIPGQGFAAGISIVRVSSSGSSPTELAHGDLLTIDLVAHNEEHLDIYGVGFTASGHDVDADGLADDGLVYVGASASESIFNSGSTPEGEPFGGLSNVVSGRHEQSYFGPHGSVFYGRIGLMFASVSLSPSNGDGSLDLGVDGRPISEGDVHMRVVFQATSVPHPVDMVLTFGAYPDDVWPVVGTRGILLPFENATYAVRILSNPEPTTAVLMGLGLLGLGIGRRR